MTGTLYARVEGETPWRYFLKESGNPGVQLQTNWPSSINTKTAKKKKKTFKNSGKIVPMSPAYKKATRERISEIITEASI